MTSRIDVITLGVADLDGAPELYEHGFGGSVRDEHQGFAVDLGANSSRLALRAWDAVASEAGVEAHSRGFRAFTLSYILDSADDVDRVLASAERHGGKVSKAPKNALWGYSAYVTDPSGYLWKIASSKRRPLLGGGEAPTANGRAIKAQEVPVTIGVADMKRAKQFYSEALGLPVKKDYRKFVMFSGEGGTSDLGMYKREALADDAAVSPEGSGFRGFMLTHAVGSAEDVDALLNAAAQAGGTIVRSGVATDGGPYSGCFADPDGNLWQVATEVEQS